MTTSKVISWLEEILPDIKRTGNPEAVMLKYASDNNLAPALLEKLAQVYNSAKTLNFLEKSADRGATFHVIDADQLVKKYVTDEPKSASVDPISDWIDGPATKSASLTTSVADRWPGQVSGHPVLKEELENHLGAKKANAKAELRARSEAQATAANYRQVVFDLNEDVNDLAVKIAERIRVLPGFDFAGLEADALGLHGDGIKAACDTVSLRLTRRHFPHKRASAAGKSRLVRDAHGLMAELHKLADAISMHKAAAALAPEYIKEATLAAPATAEKPRKPEGADEEKNPSEMAKQPEGKSRSGGSSAAAPASGQRGNIAGGMMAALSKIPVPQSPIEPVTVVQNLVREALPTRNTGQQLVDRDHADLHSQIVVERLLMTDPILSEADPHVVVSLANSIREHAPHVARDINAMRFALREAVQYQALPTHTVKDLAGVEKTRVDTESESAAQAKDRYASGPKKETKK